MGNLTLNINLPWKDKPNRGALLRTMKRVGGIVQDDISRVNRAFFPSLCSSEKLNNHGTGLGIPYLQYDTEDDFRDRVATAGFFLDGRGTRGQIYKVLDNSIPGRYDLFELPRDSFRVGFSQIGVSRIGAGFILVVKIRDMTEDEGNKIYSVLDQLLDPDIEIIVIPWIPSEISDLTLNVIRLYGGSNWLESQFSHICDVDIFILPDDAFTIGSGRVGLSMIFGEDIGEIISITAPEKYHLALIDRAEIIFHESIQWEVRSE